jgi:type IV pilus assembly protein PilY1
MQNRSSIHFPAAISATKPSGNPKDSRQSMLAHALRKRWLPLAALLSMVLAATLVVGQSAPPSIPAINLSSDPLYAATGGDKPVIALALSVEFPTVGAQYRGSADYSNTNEYLGYYDAESCYTYVNNPTETPGSGQTTADFKRFQRAGAAVSRMCNTAFPNAFSGNFLNWASNSAIDMLRLALTGGDRTVDTSTLTLLQRAYLPNGDYEDGCYFNGSYFPAKQLKKTAGTGLPNYFGAVPAAMQTTAGSNDIWIANTLNRIYFRAGSSSTGSCTDQSGYTLGVTVLSNWMGTITSYSSQPSGWPATPVYAQGASITLTGVQEVLYGRNSNWKSAPATGTITCSNAAFTGGSTSSSAQCYVRTDTTGQTPPSSTTALTTDPYFYARVKVCDVDSSGTLLDVRDYGLCTKYSDGKSTPMPNYKPTGVIQKYSEQLRLAAFGYLMDQSSRSDSGWGTGSGRYGGVLRAAMKYVGAKTFNETGVDNTPTGGNANAEWDSVTGVFATNPDGNTTISNLNGVKLSGVINYLNQFGRTGNYGRYKQYDPVGELYGESLRYLQGLGPTAAAVSSISGQEDGYPVYTSWTDPYGGTRTNANDYSCNKSNILVVGDINTWDSNRLLTRTADLTQNLPDFGAWNTVVKNFEAASSAGTYKDGTGVTRNTTNPNSANTNAQVGANGNQGPLVGAAYWAHTHDIRGPDWTASPSLQRPGLRVKTFLFDVNENSASYDASDPTNTGKMAYRRTQNQYFTASKYGGFETDASSAATNAGAFSTKSTYNTKGNPFYRDDLSTADKYVWEDTDTRTIRQGEANTYFLQSDARGVLSAFNDIFSRVSTAARSIAGAATSGKSLTSTSSNSTYQAAFDTSDWSGDVLSIPLNITGTSTVTVGAPAWSAAARLGNMATPATSRNIVIGMPGATANPVATAFTWSALGTAMQTNLAKLTPTSASDSLGQNRLNYLRGDRSNEGTSFRTRSKLLGDIINSGIVFKGTPTASVSSTTAYATFYAANASRTPALFVGANDGMLHAFNANNGDEIFGYIPSWMGSKLAALTSKTYPNNHQAYVDGTPEVAEAQVGSAGTSSDWKTVLISGTGAGGSGVFALDVTDPGTFSASKVMWEFTRADDADLGYVVGRPQILKLRTSAPGATTATYRWFALVASGVDNYVPDSLFSSAYSTTGNPALFLLALDKAAGAAWAAGTNYYKISVPADSTLSASTGTGLINFQPSGTGPAGELAQIYMGDLHGKLWKLDFAARGATEWTLDKLSPYKKGSSAPFTPYPLYIAQTAAGGVQAISMAPAVLPGPNLNGVSTAYVAFATGKYLESSDKTSTVQNSIYEIFDNGSTAADSSPVGASVISGRGRLKAGTVNVSTGVVDTPTFTWGRATSDTDAAQRSGFYADFPVSGERGITNIVVAGDYLHINSLIPTSSGAAGSCAAAGGDGKSYRINYLTGKGTVQNSTTGLLGEPLLIDLPSATTYTTSSTTGRRIKTVVQQVIQQGSLGVAASSTVTSTFVTGRLSWRQINNYQDLKNAP